MKKINWGIIGTGAIANTFALALTGVKEANLYGIASRSLEKAKAFATKHNITLSYGNYEELIDNPDIDVIYIGTPHTEHFAHAKACILGKKHVLCEKPMTINSEETKELVRLAKENQVFLMEAMWTKFLPATTCIKEWIDSDRIGRVQFMNINFGFAGEQDYSRRLFNPDLGGGALLDVGVYTVQYANFIMNKLPERIQSSMQFGISGVDELTSITFFYEDGTIATLNSSISTRLGSDAVIIGTKGKIVVENFYMASKASIYDEEDMLIETFYEPFVVNGYEYEAMEVNRCIMEGELESPRNPLNKTIQSMDIMDSIRRQWNLVYPGGK